MLLSFRQGIVQSQSDFLTKTGTTVNLNVGSSPAVFTASFGTAEYMFTEPSSQVTIAAWTNLSSTDSSWLYWDINKNTAVRTFGFTSVQPIVSATNPPSPQLNQHWFDTTANKMRFWDSIRWVECIRVFAGALLNGTTLVLNQPGTQVGSNVSYKSGRILFDGLGSALKKSDNTFFSSEDQWFVDGTFEMSNRLETDITFAQANENISSFSVVTYSDFNRIRLANYEDTSSSVLMMCIKSATYDQVTPVIFQGIITNPGWNWTTINAPLWVDTNGSLTDIDPAIINSFRPTQVPIARVTSKTTIMFMQGLGAVGPAGLTGPKGDPGLGTQKASSTITGVVKLSVEATDPLNPVAVGDNDPRNSNARTPLAHTHTASTVSTVAYTDLSATTVQQNLQELDDIKLNISGGTLTGPLTLNSDPSSAMQPATKQYVDNIPNKLITMVGDVTGSGTSIFSTTLANSGVTPGVYSKITVNSKGLVTVGNSLSNSDVTTALNFTPINKAGDVMTGLLVLSGDPVVNNGAATKHYVDSSISSSPNQPITLSGAVSGSGTGSIVTTLSSSGIIPGTYNSVTVNVNGLVTSGTNQTSVDLINTLGFTPVNISGDTMNGLLILSGNPTTSYGAATKQYVDNAITTSETTATSLYLTQTQTDGLYVKKTGDTVSGDLTVNGHLMLQGDPQYGLEAASKLYVDTQVSNVTLGGGLSQVIADQLYLSLTGGTLTGILQLASDPHTALEAATKQYVDTQVSQNIGSYVNRGGDVMTGDLILYRDPINSLGAATRQYVDVTTATRLSTSGGSMTGDLSLVGDPTSNLNAATKQYVDNSVSSLGISKSYKEIITINSNIWIITHNLNSADIMYNIYVDVNGVQTPIIPIQVLFVDNNTMQITFSVGFTGKILLLSLS
jgi:hypothetical protein